jgi:hypothetical protein
MEKLIFFIVFKVYKHNHTSFAKIIRMVHSKQSQHFNKAEDYDDDFVIIYDDHNDILNEPCDSTTTFVEEVATERHGDNTPTACMVHDDDDGDDESDSTTLEGSPDEDAYEFDSAEERDHHASDMSDSIADPSPHLDLYSLTNSFTHMLASSNVTCNDSLCRLTEHEDEDNETRADAHVDVVPKPVPLPTRGESVGHVPNEDDIPSSSCSWTKGKFFLKVLRTVLKGFVALMQQCGRGISEYATSTYRYWSQAEPHRRPRPRRPRRTVVHLGEEGIELDVLNEKEKDM